MNVHEIAPNVFLCHDEESEIWSYTTPWGTIRDVYGMIGKIVTTQFNYPHGIDFIELKKEGFTSLYLGMLNFNGQRSIGSYASYFIFNGMRDFVELYGNMGLNQPYLTMKSYKRIWTMYYKPKEIPESCLPWELKYFKDPGRQIDYSAFWDKAEKIALSCKGKPNRNWLITKAMTNGLMSKEIAAQYGCSPQNISKVSKRLCRQMHNLWPDARMDYERCKV